MHQKTWSVLAPKCSEKAGQMQAGRSCIHQLWSSPLGPCLLICISSNGRCSRGGRATNQPLQTPVWHHVSAIRYCSLTPGERSAAFPTAPMTWIRFKYATLKMDMKNAGVCSSLAHLRQFLQNPKWFQAALRFWQPRAASSLLWGEGKRVQAASSPLTLSREQSPRGRHWAQHSKDWWPRRRSVAPTGWETGTKTTWTMEGAFPSSAPASNSSSSGTGSLQV